jgi:glycosyltransferase involved in cell wall biosynthesis
MEADLDAKANTILYSEGLEKRKNIDKMIRALDKIKEKRKKLAYEFDLRLLRKMRRI